ncbi:hypothetical protein SAMN05661099_0648 [Daejeonella lutea]|uniref:Uncharacterized protein n=1 Tax=Daejeonella lutea TaxID=572036 RepID=A0A1T5AEU5_9SPHI|nr:hypothetical protein SAMN05661099_0648 [Daejeonella lutea]
MVRKLKKMDDFLFEPFPINHSDSSERWNLPILDKRDVIPAKAGTSQFQITVLSFPRRPAYGRQAGTSCPPLKGL